MITHLTIQHYKSIESLELRLPALAVFVGPNGSGKSNLVDAVCLIRDAVVHGLDHAVSERHGIDSLRQWSPSKPYYIKLGVQVENRFGKGSLSFTLASYKGNHLVREEEGVWTRLRPERGRVTYHRDKDGRVKLTGDLRFLGPPREKIRAEQPEELVLQQFQALGFMPLVRALASFEAYSIFPNVLRTPQKGSQDDRLGHSGENLTSVFKALTRSKRQAHARARAEILTAMRQVLPTLENIRIQSLGGLMVPMFRVKERDGRLHDFNVSQVSDGTLRVLGLLTALYQPSRPDVIALEEPEQTVHPGVLAILADAIKDVSAHTQILVTTHSPELVDRFAPENVMAVDMEAEVTRVGPISAHQQQAVKERLFSLGELMAVEGLHP